MGWFRDPPERERWAAPLPLVRPQAGIGLGRLDPQGARLYGTGLPRHAGIARPDADRPPVNRWLPPADLMNLRWQPGQLMLGKLGGVPLGQTRPTPQPRGRIG